MLPGPTIYLECNVCKNTIEIITISSGNAFFARYWTDDYSTTPKLPLEFSFKKCPHCRSLFWIDDLKELGVVDWLNGDDEPDKAWGKSKSALNFDLTDYFIALENNFPRTTEEIKDLRMNAWWLFNHRFRWPQTRNFFFKKKPLEPLNILAFHNNLTSLQDLLNIDVQSERILIAEIYRELGRFEECERLLDFEFNESLLNVREFILRYCKEQNSVVQDMTDYLNEKQRQAKEKYTLQRNKYIEYGINFVKSRAIDRGIATEDNFYSVVHKLSVEEFVELRGNYKDLHTIHFPKS